MPEGLNFAEVHHEFGEHEGSGHESRGRLGRWLTVAEALLLSAVTMTVAWSGFAAAKWNTESQQLLSSSALVGVQSSRADLDAQLLRNFDESTFNSWFAAYVSGDATKMKFAEERFRPEMKVAFDAWMATDPENNTDAPEGPTFMPEYNVALEVEAEALEAEAVKLHEEGVRAGQTGDEFVRSTVVLAGVLFLIGMGRTFTMPSVRVGLIGVGMALLGLALSLIVQLPAIPA